MGDDWDFPMSQLAADAGLNPVVPLSAPGGPTDYAGLLGGAGQPAGHGAAAGSAAAEAGPRRHGKLFNDPIHNTFRLSPECIDLIDSPAFQRLRRLKQLGVTYYVFPG